MHKYKGGIKVLFTLPNLITLVNLSLGILAIYYALNKILLYGFLMILLAALVDSLDGLIARALHLESPIGKELDSLADMISFGAAPSIMFILIHEQLLAVLVAVIYTSCGALRLARFNIYGSKKFFEGLPIPAAAVFISSTMITIGVPIYRIILIILASALMISPITYPSIKVQQGIYAVSTLIILGFLTMLYLEAFYPVSFAMVFTKAVWIFSLYYVMLSPLIFWWLNRFWRKS